LAWNPTPEVAVARDAARILADLADDAIDMLVIVYVTQGGKLGYVSYGHDAARCAEAKKLAEVLYAATQKRYDVSKKAGCAHLETRADWKRDEGND